ncbi:MAG: NAD(P)H-dependent oxidoreductase [Epsilonproteobacteria bacterium]|nr:NAD(P)H-dependent oxidoreductase [Campylobacterota bacterium]
MKPTQLLAPHTLRSLLKKSCVLACLLVMMGCHPEPTAGADELSQENSMKTTPMKVAIIVGSVRPTGTADKIVNNLKRLLDARTDIQTELLFVRDYALPFYTDTMAPADRTEPIADPVLKKWSDAVKRADGYIIVSPEYNAGYPAPLKNALDSLYKEWNYKPVAFVGYSGGQSGGTSSIAQLHQVAQALKLIPIAVDVKIPQSWKAFTSTGDLVMFASVQQELNRVVDLLLVVHHAPQSR